MSRFFGEHTDVGGGAGEVADDLVLDLKVGVGDQITIAFLCTSPGSARPRISAPRAVACQAVSR